MDIELLQLMDSLAEPFEEHEIKWKPQSVKKDPKGDRALAIAYVDARVIQDRLDEVMGVAGWTDEYKVLDDGSVMCKLSLFVGGAWVVKTDVGSPSEQPDSGDRMKAAFSDALKRAAVKWGIGRYLYRCKSAWLPYDARKGGFSPTPKLNIPAIMAPKPRVTVAKIEPEKPLPLTGVDPTRLEAMANQARRLAELGGWKPGEVWRKVLRQANVDPKKKATDLTIDEYQRVTRYIFEELILLEKATEGTELAPPTSIDMSFGDSYEGPVLDGHDDHTTE